MKTLIHRRYPSSFRKDNGLAERPGFRRMNSPKAKRAMKQSFRGFPGNEIDFGLRGSLAGEPPHLALHELPIEPVTPDQKIGRTVLDNLAQLKNDDTVKVPDR